jgi:HD-GYP domain-containing protein (c-di-GMP phosphodiesterase class II)
MRYVPINCVTEGMVLARPVLGKNGELLLNTGNVLVSSYIKKLIKLGYSGLYIEDEFSEGLEIEDIINVNLRFKAVNMIKKTFAILENERKLTEENLVDICAIVTEILEDILSRKELAVNMIDLKVFDDYTFYHSVNVTALSMVIAVSMGFSRNKVHTLGMSALLHDMGKVFIPKEILNKKSTLTEHEFSIIQTHPKKGYEFLREHSAVPAAVYPGVLQHHERYDGTGYPKGLKKDNISMISRILGVTDVYDALTSDRPYRKSLKPSESIEYIMGGSGTLFDPAVVADFLQKVSPYPLGTAVLLSNGCKGIVIHKHQDNCLRPQVRIVKHGDKKVTPYIVDLKEDKSMIDVVIVDITNI